jgi:hypothetical protein
MKIYLEQGEVGDMKQVIRRRGELLTMLHGINLSHRNGKLEIIPMYQPFVHWRKHTGQIVIVIGFRLPLMLVVLQKRVPFIHVQIIKEEELE